MVRRTESEFYAAYEVNFQNLQPDVELSQDQRKLLEILIKFGIFVLQDVNEKISGALTEILDIPRGFMSEYEDELDELEEKLDDLHSSFYRIHKFVAHLTETYIVDEAKRAELLLELIRKAPLTNHDPDSESEWFEELSGIEYSDDEDDDSTASNLSEADFAAAADTEEEVDNYFNEIYESDWF